MRFGSDLLYSVFEKSLLVPHNQPEDITLFIDKVIYQYLVALAQEGMTVPPKMRKMFEADLREEVIDMTRKKIYGYASIDEYRKMNAEMIEQYYKENA